MVWKNDGALTVDDGGARLSLSKPTGLGDGFLQLAYESRPHVFDAM